MGNFTAAKLVQEMLLLQGTPYIQGKIVILKNKDLG